MSTSNFDDTRKVRGGNDGLPTKVAAISSCNNDLTIVSHESFHRVCPLSVLRASVVKQVRYFSNTIPSRFATPCK